MALTATIFNLQIDLADADRGVYESLERAYAAMGMTEVAADARRMARGISDAAGREPSTAATQLLGRAKDAYAAAQFQEAVRRLPLCA